MLVFLPALITSHIHQQHQDKDLARVNSERCLLACAWAPWWTAKTVMPRGDLFDGPALISCCSQKTYRLQGRPCVVASKTKCSSTVSIYLTDRKSRSSLNIKENHMALQSGDIDKSLTRDIIKHSTRNKWIRNNTHLLKYFSDLTWLNTEVLWIVCKL